MGKYEFLWRGKDKSGRTRAERVWADNAQEARLQLRNEGWSDLELIKDELVTSEAFKIEPDPCMDDEPNEFDTPEYDAKFFEGKGPGVVSQTLKAIVESWFMLLVSAAAFALGYYRHQLWLMITGAAVFAFLVLLTPAIHLFFTIFGTSKKFDRLLRAKLWGRWDEVLEAVEALEKRDWLTGGKIPALELVKSRAQAYAAQGQLEEGLKIFSKLEHHSNIEHWVYLSFLASVYDVGKSHEQALELRRQAAIEKPDNSAVWIDLSYTCVRWLNRPAEAREFLAKAQALELTGLGKAYLPFLRGIICWRERKMSEAVKELEQALVSFKPWVRNPQAEGLIFLGKAHLCACHRALGNRAKADKLFQQVKAFLEAHKENELIAACAGPQ